jgi:hypothetical protein
LHFDIPTSTVASNTKSNQNQQPTELQIRSVPVSELGQNDEAMNHSALAFPLLRLRNALHSLAPGSSETAEIIRQTLQFKKVVEKKGYQLPLPAFVKRSILKRNLLDHELQTLVETGTQYGDTPWLFRNELQEIWSIELSPQLSHLARRRFQKFPHIHIIEGDSTHCLAEVIPQLKTPTLFWLDGHYSSGVTARGTLDCPIYAELQAIFSTCKQRWVILIDDARSFGTEKDYPSLEELSTFIRSVRSDSVFSVENDIIKIAPQSP